MHHVHQSDCMQSQNKSKTPTASTKEQEHTMATCGASVCCEVGVEGIGLRSIPANAIVSIADGSSTFHSKVTQNVSQNNPSSSGMQ